MRKERSQFAGCVRRLLTAMLAGSSAVACVAFAAHTPDVGPDQDVAERRSAESVAELSTSFLKPDLSRQDPIAATDKGRVRGYYSEAGVATFLGIPYAKPPVGDLRWRPPESPAPWSNTLETKHFSATCAQITTLGVFAGPITYNEDCLYLNVFTPTHVNPDKKVPVLVWIHGGGNFDGESNDYDATKLVTDGKMIVVTFNYRLGLLGWLAHPALDSEGHLFGNYGLLDQQAVLRWVQSNIAKFGGDPNNVTLGGQSAGAFNTSANMASPLAKGLFHRAILQSLFSDSKPLSAAREIGQQFASAAGCGSGASSAVRSCLRNLPASTIMNIQGTPQNQGSLAIIDNISDGTIIPAEGILATFKSGNFNKMPVMSGVAHDEFNFPIGVTEYWTLPRMAITTAQYTNWVWSSFGQDDGNKILAQFPPSAYQTPQLAWNAAGSGWQLCPHYAVNRVLSQKVPLYAYEYNYQHTPSYMPKMPGYESLAYHTGDIQFLFQYYHGGPKGIPRKLNRAEQALSDKLVRAWSYFAYTGNPNGQGNSPWPRYVASASQPSYYLSQNIPEFNLITDTKVNEEHKCDFWGTLPSF